MISLEKRLKQYQEAFDKPSELSAVHYQLAYDFAFYSEQYQNLIPALVTSKRNLMEKLGTVSKADREFAATEEGIQEQQLKIYLKAVEKLLSAVKRRLETLNEEARNQY